MSENENPIDDSDWRAIVKNVPIVSVDLLVKHEGGIVLGKRRNNPAKGEWFVPGGTVLKGEKLTEAVQRIANQELSSEVKIQKRMGAYEHFYESSEVSGVEEKHYLANAFVVSPLSNDLTPDEQHSELRVFEPKFEQYDFHPYVKRYLNDIYMDEGDKD